MQAEAPVQAYGHVTPYGCSKQRLCTKGESSGYIRGFKDAIGIERQRDRQGH